MKKIEGKRSDAPDEKQSYIIDCCNRFAYAQWYAEHFGETGDNSDCGRHNANVRVGRQRIWNCYSR